MTAPANEPVDPTPERDLPDPDADLIAYLDGELDGADAARVEDRLAIDPSARSKAEAYKKTYDLLDYLPKTEPSPDFATRTLTRLQPTMSASGLGATVGYTGSAATLRATRTSWRSVFAWLAASAVALGVGFVAHAGLRPYVSPPPKADELLFSDHRVIDHLPLYLAADDLEFVKALDDPDLFAPDPLNPTSPRPDPLPDASPASHEKLTALFKSFPPARQQQLRELDQQFHELPQPDRDHLGRVLESYAVWVDRLADGDRRELLVAPNAAARLDVVRRLREKTWRSSLPAVARERLKHIADAEERVQMAESLRAVERTRAEEWAIARRQWDMLHGPDRKPWPFTEPALAAQVDDYVKTVLKADLARTDMPLSCRVTRDEFLELKSRYEAATKDGHWFWYGLYVHRLAGVHPYLPEPETKPMIVDQNSLPQSVRKEANKGGALQPFERRATRGKWPEFVLEIADGLKRAGHNVPESLGPSKLTDFKPGVQAFLTESVFPKLTPTERESLRKLEGKFPEYPRQVVELAGRSDEPIPGVMLPGKPSLWAKNYSLPSTARKRK